MYYIPNMDDLNENLDEIAQPDDMVVGIGGGTIWRYIENYYNHLENTKKNS